jgi:hypothetical protein
MMGEEMGRRNLIAEARKCGNTEDGKEMIGRGERDDRKGG